MRRGRRIVCGVVSTGLGLGGFGKGLVMGAITFRKWRELPIWLWGWLDVGGGDELWGMLPGRERGAGGGEMDGFMRCVGAAWMS